MRTSSKSSIKENQITESRRDLFLDSSITILHLHSIYHFDFYEDTIKLFDLLLKILRFLKSCINKSYALCPSERRRFGTEQRFLSILCWWFIQIRYALIPCDRDVISLFRNSSSRSYLWECIVSRARLVACEGCRTFYRSRCLSSSQSSVPVNSIDTELLGIVLSGIKMKSWYVRHRLSVLRDHEERQRASRRISTFFLHRLFSVVPDSKRISGIRDFCDNRTQITRPFPIDRLLKKRAYDVQRSAARSRRWRDARRYDCL